MIDWYHKDTVADLREKISTLRAMLRDAHRREDALVRKSRLKSDSTVGDDKNVKVPLGEFLS